MSPLPLDHLAFLRGLCARALRQYFVGTEQRLRLHDGIPLPFVTRRPILDVYASHTPSNASFNRGKLLTGVQFTLFKNPSGTSIGVEIDYGNRKRLDELTWRNEGSSRLPRVATVHPQLGSDGIAVDQPDREAGLFFGVRPRRFDLEAVLAQLRTVAHQAEIAVLPELSLPPQAVEQLGTALAGAPSRYPPLVVAGSAHQETVKAFIDFMRTSASQAVMKQKGFEPL